MDELSAPRTFLLRDHWPLLPILVLATLLRLWQINESLWLDELHSAWVVSAGAAEIVDRAQIGNQSPLYFYLPWATTSLFGMSEWALRLPSLAAGVGLVGLAYGLAYEFTCSRIAACVCSLLAALDHNFLFYATEARPYACVQLMAAVQLYFFWRLHEASPVRRRIAFVAATVALFYLHYTAILLVTGEMVFIAARVRGCCHRETRAAYTCRKFVIDLLCVAGCILPAIFHVLDIGSRRSDWALFIHDTSVTLLIHWFALDSYVVLPTILWILASFFCMRTLSASSIQQISRCQRAVTIRPENSSAHGGDSGISRSGSLRPSVTVALLFCWFVTPLAIVWLLTLTDVARLFLARYVMGAALSPILFAGVCIGFWRDGRLQAVLAGIVLAYAFSTSGMIEQLQRDGRLFGDRAENWRDAVRYVNEDNDWVRDSPVFVRSGLLEADQLVTDESELLRAYCVLPVTSIYRIDRTDSEIRPLTTRDPGQLTKDDVKRIEASGAAWFIINGTTATRERCAQRILESLAKDIQTATHKATQGGLVEGERQFGNVGAFAVTLDTVDDQVTPLDHQPTSPNSIAPP